MTTNPTGPSEAAAAWSDAWTEIRVMMAEHTPLVAAMVVVAVSDIIRRAISPSGDGLLARVSAGALGVAEITLLASLVAPKGIELVCDLAERTGVGIFRVKHAFRTGTYFQDPDDDHP